MGMPRGTRLIVAALVVLTAGCDPGASRGTGKGGNGGGGGGGGASPSALVSATTRGRKVNRCSNATVAAMGLPSCVAGRNLRRRAAAIADSSKPKPAPCTNFTSVTSPAA